MTQSPILRHRAILIPPALFALALATRVTVARAWRFDGLYGQDSFAYFDQATSLAEQLARGQMVPPDFFWPNGFPTLAALSMTIFGATPATVQALNMVLGAAVVVLVFLIGRDLMTTWPGNIDSRHAGRVGLAAAVATMVSGQLVLSSVVVMADTSALFWLALSTWILIRFVRSPASWLLPATAAAAGVAGVVTRWATALAGPALAVVAAIALRKCQRRGLVAATAVTAALLVGLPQLAISLSGRDGGFSGYFSDWSLLNIVHRTVETKEGVTSYIFPNGVFYLAPWWHPGLLLPTIGLFALPGLAVFWRRNISALLAAGLWIVVPYTFFVGIPHQNLRYCLTMWIPAVTLAAVGVVEVMKKPGWRVPVACLLLASLLGSVFWNISWWDRFFDRHNTVKALAFHLNEALPPDAVILSFEATLTLKHYTHADVHELYSMDTDELQACTGRDGGVWAVVDPSKITSQWRNLAPGKNLKWLRDNRQLTVVGEYPPWVVYSIHPSNAEPLQP